MVVESGDAAAFDLGENRHVVLISARAQTSSRNIFEDLGVDLGKKRVVVVKSSQHFHASFSEVAGEILYAAPPGVMTPDLKSLPYEFADTTLWPLRDYPVTAARRDGNSSEQRFRFDQPPAPPLTALFAACRCGESAD